MGCSGAGTKRDKLYKLNSLISNSILEKSKEIRFWEKILTLYNYKINKLKQEIIKNNSIDSHSQKIQRAKKLKPYLIDSKRIEKHLDYLRQFNELLKNNKNLVDSKIQALNDLQQMQEINYLLKDFDDDKSKEILEENINILLKQKNIEQQNMDIIQNGIKELSPDVGNEEDYLNSFFNK